MGNSVSSKAHILYEVMYGRYLMIISPSSWHIECKNRDRNSDEMKQARVKYDITETALFVYQLFQLMKMTQNKKFIAKAIGMLNEIDKWYPGMKLMYELNDPRNNNLLKRVYQNPLEYKAIIAEAAAEAKAAADAEAEAAADAEAETAAEAAAQAAAQVAEADEHAPLLGMRRRKNMPTNMPPMLCFA